MEFIRVAFVLSCFAFLGSFASEFENGRLGNGVEHMCEDFVSSLVKSFEDREETKIVQFLKENICDNLVIGQETCKMAVDAIVPGIIKKIENEANPKKICTAIFKNSKFSNEKKETLLNVIQLLSSNSVNCEGCKIVSQAILDTLVDPEVQMSIIDFATTNFCPILGSGAEDCKDTLLLYAPDILSNIATDLSTDLLCAKLGSCEKKADLDVHTMVEEVKEEDVDGAENFNMKCITCKSIVRTIERHIHGERTESKIMHSMDKACDNLPVPFLKAKCRRFVDVKLKRVVDAFASELQPAEICQLAGACA